MSPRELAGVVIPTEAKPSGGIWLHTRSKFGHKPDVSTALDMTKL